MFTSVLQSWSRAQFRRVAALLANTPLTPNMLTLTGFGLTLRAVEARFRCLSLTEYRGLYDHSPALAVCYLLTGLGTVGLPMRALRSDERHLAL